MPESTGLLTRVVVNVSRAFSGSGRRAKRSLACSAASTPAGGWEAPVRTQSKASTASATGKTPQSLHAVERPSNADKETITVTRRYAMSNVRQHKCVKLGECSSTATLLKVCMLGMVCIECDRPLLIPANFGVGQGPPAVQFAREGPPVLGLRSTAMPGVGVRRQLHLLRDGPNPTIQTTLGTRNKCGTVLPDVKNHATHEIGPTRFLGQYGNVRPISASSPHSYPSPLCAQLLPCLQSSCTLVHLQPTMILMIDVCGSRPTLKTSHATLDRGETGEFATVLPTSSAVAPVRFRLDVFVGLRHAAA